VTLDWTFYRQIVSTKQVIEELIVQTAEPDRAPSLNHLGGPALRTFFNIAKAWALTEAEQMKILGLRNRSTLKSWESGAVTKISRDALERVSYVLGIYKAIHILLPNPANADAWIRKPNKAPIFDGRSALERMTAGNVSDLYAVRQYLDAERE
jgi:hypothetical protein